MSLLIGAAKGILLPRVNLAMMGFTGLKGVMGDLLLRLWMCSSKGMLLPRLMVVVAAIITTRTCRADACKKVELDEHLQMFCKDYRAQGR